MERVILDAKQTRTASLNVPFVLTLTWFIEGLFCLVQD